MMIHIDRLNRRRHPVVVPIHINHATTIMNIQHHLSVGYNVYLLISFADDKTIDWINRFDDDNIQSIVDKEEIQHNNNDDESNNKRSLSCSSRVAPVQRRKFPLGATIEQRGPDRSIIIERF